MIIIKNKNFIYESNDFDKMLNFLIKEHKKRKGKFTWHIARLVDWKYNLLNLRKIFTDNFQKNAQLWFDDLNELVGFTISEEFDNSFFILLDDKYNFLYDEMINWILKTSKDNQNPDSIYINLTEDQEHLAMRLKSFGFKKTNSLEITKEIDTSTYKDFDIKDRSIIFENMLENGDYNAQTALRKNAWNNNIIFDLDKEIRAFCRRSPLYNAEFDFVIRKNNQIIAGCEAFIDQKNKTAEIERVCTHSDYMNNGYSQIILKMTMKKLYEHGIFSAYLTGWDEKTNYIYGKLGCSTENKRYVYELIV